MTVRHFKQTVGDTLLAVGTKDFDNLRLVKMGGVVDLSSEDESQASAAEDLARHPNWIELDDEGNFVEPPSSDRYPERHLVSDAEMKAIEDGDEDTTQEGAVDDGPDPAGDAGETGDGASGHDAGQTGPESAPAKKRGSKKAEPLGTSDDAGSAGNQEVSE